jgi:hypothetical protein
VEQQPELTPRAAPLSAREAVGTEPGTSPPAGAQPDGGAVPATPLTPEQEEARGAVLTQRAQELATQGLESARQSAVTECWPEGVPSGAGSLVDFTYNIAIDENGDEVGRGYTAASDGGAPELLDCLRDHSGPPVHMVPPPGRRLNLNVDFSYP